MKARSDWLAVAIRFSLGSLAGAFAAFWLALTFERMNEAFGLVAAGCSLLGGLLAQIASYRWHDWAERAAPYVLGALALATAAVVIATSEHRRASRSRCDRCCKSAGFSAFVYAPEYRTGRRYCSCASPSRPELPQSDSRVCLNSGRG